MSFESLKNVINKLFVYKSYVFMYKEDVSLNNLQGLICHKTEPNVKHVSECCSLRVVPKSCSTFSFYICCSNWPIYI